MVASAAAAATVAGSVISSSMASDAQTSAAKRASNTELKMFNDVRQSLQPYMNVGTAGVNRLMGATGLNAGQDALSSPLLKPITMDQATLEQTPGYKFNLNQGLNAVNNSAAARGLGDSGAALRGAADYATGLADSTYQQQFANATMNQENQFNRLMALTQLGQNSAAGVGSMGLQTASNIAGNTIGAGNAQAGAYTNIGNSITSGANNMAAYSMMQGMYGNQGAGGITWNGPRVGTV